MKRKIKASKVKVNRKPQMRKRNVSDGASSPPQQTAKMPNHIQEYFAKVEGTKEMFNSRELFRAEKENVDIKTDLTFKEISYINTLMFNNWVLKSAGLYPIYEIFLEKYMRLKISLDRKSRGEFVSINRGDKTEEAVGLLSSLSNITNSKK